MTQFTERQANDHLSRVARGFAPLVADRILGFAEAADAIDHTIWCDPRFAGFDEKSKWRISEAAHWQISDAIITPELRASEAIRSALGPLMAGRRPRAELLIAAYRAANGKLSASEVEGIVVDEISSYVVRIRQSRGLRNAG